VVIEQTNEWPVKIGSVYRSKNTTGTWSKLIVTALEENKIFFLARDDNNFQVKYTFAKIDPDLTELEYEVNSKEKIETPFIVEILDNLKKVLES